MNLTVITNKKEINAAQRELEARIHGAATGPRRLKLGYQGGAADAEVWYIARGDMWFASDKTDNRYWNALGFGDPDGTETLSIVAEVNPSFDGSRRSAGAFLRDPDGKVWLAHSGRVGGGKKGVGKKAFLDAFTGSVETVDGQEYVLIGRIDAKDFLAKLAGFVRTVQSFKAGIGGEVNDDEADAAPSYWKIAPGEKARLWPECRDGGYIAIGWRELGDLSGLDRDGFDTRRDKALEEHPDYDWKRRGVDQVWRFFNIPPGAKIVANDGTRRVVGIGTVTGPYRFVDDSNEFAHRLPVRWEDVRERVVEQPGWLRTVIQLSPAAFAEVLNAPSPGEAVPEAPVQEAKPTEQLDFGGIMDRLEAAKLQFPEELVASYLLALQAKRFVILSGISGTGKTQLALEVAKAFQPARAVLSTQLTLEDGLRLRVGPYMLKYGKWVVPRGLADRLMGAEDSLDLTLRFGSEEEKHRWGPAAHTTHMRFRPAFREWFAKNFSVGDEIQVRVESEDPATLRISKVGLEAPAASLEPPLTSPAPHPVAVTYQVIAVRPDWTDNRGLLGYYNPISREYRTTPFLRLLLAASDEASKAVQEGRSPLPYFVVLDEMNLARVEHYFSDFLSCLESGEPLHLHDDASIDEGESESGEVVPMQLSISRNLFFTGTVNVDETTYMFSPKVLDRAFVLEFNDVDLDSLGDLSGDEGGSEGSVLRLKHFAGALDIRERASRDDYQQLREFGEGSLHRALSSLNTRLLPEHRHFGYRVANEIARFVGLAVAQAGKDPEVLWEALDVAVLAKVLPKLHGTQQEVEEVLGRLLAFAVDVGSEVNSREHEAAWTYENGRLAAKSGVSSKVARLPRCAAKLWRMLRRVRQQGYVSFIE